MHDMPSSPGGRSQRTRGKASWAYQPAAGRGWDVDGRERTQGNQVGCSSWSLSWEKGPREHPLRAEGLPGGGGGSEAPPPGPDGDKKDSPQGV